MKRYNQAISFGIDDDMAEAIERARTDYGKKTRGEAARMLIQLALDWAYTTPMNKAGKK